MMHSYIQSGCVNQGLKICCQSLHHWRVHIDETIRDIESEERSDEKGIFLKIPKKRSFVAWAFGKYDHDDLEEILSEIERLLALNNGTRSLYMMLMYINSKLKETLESHALRIKVITLHHQNRNSFYSEMNV